MNTNESEHVSTSPEDTQENGGNASSSGSLQQISTLREQDRWTINGEDILISLHALGFENYAEVLKIYLAKYRQQQALKNQLMYEQDDEEVP